MRSATRRRFLRSVDRHALTLGYTACAVTVLLVERIAAWIG